MIIYIITSIVIILIISIIIFNNNLNKDINKISYSSTSLHPSISPPSTLISTSTSSSTSPPSTLISTSTSSSTSPLKSTIIQVNPSIEFINTNYYLIENNTKYMNLDIISNIYKLKDAYYVLLSNNNIYSSISLINTQWTLVSPNNTDIKFKYLLFVNNTLFAIGNTTSYSSLNGTSWNLIQITNSLNTYVDLGNISDGTADICYDNGTFYLLLNNSIYKKQSDLTYWSKIFPATVSTIIYKHISSGYNQLILSDDKNIYYYDNTITSFTKSNYSNNNRKNIKKFIFINGLFIGISNDIINNSSGEITPLGGILYSTDGNNWTEIYDSSLILYNYITYDDNKIIAFGTNINKKSFYISIGTIDIKNKTITCTHYNYNKYITDLVLK
jgi:hypothetical protein